MIQKSTKTSYKLKEVKYDAKGFLMDDEGNYYDLKADLRAVFGTELFTLTAMTSTTESYDTPYDSDFSEEQE